MTNGEDGDSDSAELTYRFLYGDLDISDLNNIENSETNDSPKSFIDKLQYVLNIILIVLLLGAIALLILDYFESNSSTGDIAALITGLATVLLVSITYSYVEETNNLVKLTRRQNHIRIKENYDELQGFRKAIINEMEIVSDWDSFEAILENHEENIVSAPTVVYESNPDKVGKLEPTERKHVIKYYSKLLLLKDSVDKIDSDTIITENEDLNENIKLKLDEISDDRDKALEKLRNNANLEN